MNEEINKFHEAGREAAALVAENHELSAWTDIEGGEFASTPIVDCFRIQGALSRPLQETMEWQICYALDGGTREQREELVNAINKLSAYLARRRDDLIRKDSQPYEESSRDRYMRLFERAERHHQEFASLLHDRLTGQE